jgi:hypothetical protein
MRAKPGQHAVRCGLPELRKFSRSGHTLARTTRGPLNFLEGARFDLPDPLARDMELRSEVFERERRIDQLARLEYVAFAVVEDREGQAKRRPPGLVLLTLGETRLLVRTLLHQPVLPLD